LVIDFDNLSGYVVLYFFGVKILPTSVQIVAARALLELEQRELARLAKVHVTTLVRLEGAGWDVAPGNATTIARITTVLEGKGVEFIENGVRVNRKPRR
jgi:predicted transcriptional regulator